MVDSWLLDDGTAIDRPAHDARFVAGCAALVPELDGGTVRRFLAEMDQVLPGRGRWFPRVEAYAGDGAPPRLAVLVRPAPPAAGEIVLWTSPGADPRRYPRHKGPDLAALAALREQARHHGADDAVLLSADGIVLETAHAALAWRRGDVLCLPDRQLPRLHSVTAGRWAADLAAAGVPVRYERCRPAELVGAEVWALNALHGRRLVTGWVGDQAPSHLAGGAVALGRRSCGPC